MDRASCCMLENKCEHRIKTLVQLTNLRGCTFTMMFWHRHLCCVSCNMQIPGSMYFGEMCECNNFECGLDTRARLCSGEESIIWHLWAAMASILHFTFWQWHYTSVCGKHAYTTSQGMHLSSVCKMNTEPHLPQHLVIHTGLSHLVCMLNVFHMLCHWNSIQLTHPQL